MTITEDRLAALESRLKQLEDQLAIYQLMASYGPAVDSGSSARASELWADDGVYDLHTQFMRGQQDVIDELEGEWHQGLIAKGSAHIVSMPYVSVHGDEAVATCHSRLYLRNDDGNGYRVISCSANRWELAREENGWRVKHRTSRKLDGSDESHDLLARGVVDDGVADKSV